MDKKGFSLLVSSGVVDRVVVSRDASTCAGWSIFIYQDHSAPPPFARWNGAAIRTSRGDLREFKTLESALSFLRSCGWNRNFTVEEMFQS